ncbi:zinc finger MYM-type protein 1 [Bemisia tabaci]|uniref:zinc finger MYM-type protein 1 n=1 Tax=Bemisia tabaci TaxID=7038 RepID=UPI003B2844F1
MEFIKVELAGCIIKDLLTHPFSARPLYEQISIVNAGRPTPELPNLTHQSAKFQRHFQTTIYSKCNWLTGSPELNALFCWNCLLFGHDRQSSWTKTGFTNLNNLVNAVNRHEVTVTHLRASLCFLTFGSSKGDKLSDNQLDAEISLHNQKVRRNREILRRLINAVSFLTKQELAFRNKDKKEISNNSGNYVELLKYTGNYDSLLADHLENPTKFDGTAIEIQNEIIEACGETILQAIKQELKEAYFVSIIVSETTDVPTQAQFSIVLRYVYKGEARERFLGFCDIEDKTARAIVEKIRQCLTEFECNEKLVAQAYDGALFMANHLNGVQAQLKGTHPFASFVYCYVYEINKVLSKNVTLIPECKIFFSSASLIAAFFSQSSRRGKYLDEFLSRRLPQICPTGWNYSSRLISTLCGNRSLLINVFETMLACPDEVEADILASANSFLSLFEDFQFNFLLKMFNKIFAYTDLLHDVLQDQLSDILNCHQTITDVQLNIASLYDDFENVYRDTEELVGEPSKKKSTDYKLLYYEVIDTIVNQIEFLFLDYRKLTFLSLLSHHHFWAYEQTFPYDPFQSLLDSYGKFFDEGRLKNELIVVYSSEEFSEKTLADMASMLNANAFLRNSFPQLDRLVSLLYTVPISTTSVNSSVSTLRRVKNYCRYNSGEERISHLPLLSIERDLMAQLQSDNQFYEDVYSFFSQNEHRKMDFDYR